MTDREKLEQVFRDIAIPFAVIDEHGCDYVPDGDIVVSVSIEATAGELQAAASFKFTEGGKFLGVKLANFTKP